MLDGTVNDAVEAKGYTIIYWGYQIENNKILSYFSFGFESRSC